MIFVNDDETKNKTVSKSQVQSLQQEIEVLQGQVEALNTSLNTVNTAISNLDTKTKDSISQTASAASSELQSKIDGLKDSLSQQLNTASLIADYLQANTGKIIDLQATDAVIKAEEVYNSQITELEATAATVGELKAEISEVNKETVNYLKATVAEIDEFDISALSTDSLDTIKAAIDNLSSKNINTDKLYVNHITYDDRDDWNEPIGAPDNTELLKFTIPLYDGIITLLTENGKFSFNYTEGSFLAFNQDIIGYIYRVDLYNDRTEIFTTIAVPYRFISVGGASAPEITTELVDRTLYSNNISSLKGVVYYKEEEATENKDEDLAVRIVEEIPTVGRTNTIYIVNGKGSYYYDGAYMRSIISDTTEDIDFSE